MTKSEEIFIILKRIPEQYSYISDLVNSNYHLYSVHELRFINKDKIDRFELLLDSAQGVLDNLIDRLNELIYGEHDIDKGG